MTLAQIPNGVNITNITFTREVFQCSSLFPFRQPRQQLPSNITLTHHHPRRNLQRSLEEEGLSKKRKAAADQDQAAKGAKCKKPSFRYASENLSPEEAERLRSLEWENVRGLWCNLCQVRLKIREPI